MATIDEILDAMPEEDAATGRDYLVIDPGARSITVPASEKIFGVEGDEDAARKYFICPRYVGDNLDLASMFLTVYWRNANGDEDGYLVQDVETDGNYVTFSWLLGPEVVAYKGAVQFSVCADLPNTPTKRRPDWNTTTATGEVLEGQHPDLGDVAGETSDVVTQLRAEIQASTAAVEAAGAAQVDVVKAQGTNTTQEAVAAIQAQGDATRASIPADYTALAATVDRLTRDRAAAIVCQAEGTAIQVADASNDPLQGLRIFGRSTQDGTPTPEAPVEIVSTPEPVVTICGKNLLKNEAVSHTVAGITYTVNNDGSITANGTSTAVSPCIICNEFLFKAGIAYKLTGCPAGGSTTAYRIDNVSTLYDDGAGGYITCATDTVSAIRIRIAAGVTVNNLTFRPMLRLAEIEDDTYEPYAGQALTITTPGSLPGIPVASGGNYTDANGQEWVCDEVDLARGVYVQRIIEKTLDGTQAYETSGRQIEGTYTGYANFASIWAPPGGLFVSDKFSCYSEYDYPDSPNEGIYTNSSAAARGAVIVRLSSNRGVTDTTGLKEWLAKNPVTVLCPLKTPLETALTDVELQAYLAMRSCKPTTTALNDAGAHMALEYAADPKTYIDNKLAALVAANS